MAELPETRESLLVKIRDPDDGVAWDRFVSAYRPGLYRLARRRGLQDADAEDLAQQVIAIVARAIGDWRRDSSKGTFRAWLTRVARNASVNLLTRGHFDAARGGTSVAEGLEQCPDLEDPIATLIEEEHQRSLFRWAAEEIRPEFQETTWLAFWTTTVDGASVEHAAEMLNKSMGAVYAARSRVMRRLKERVSEFDMETPSASRG